MSVERKGIQSTHLGKMPLDISKSPTKIVAKLLKTNYGAGRQVGAPRGTTKFGESALLSGIFSTIPTVLTRKDWKDV